MSAPNIEIYAQHQYMKSGTMDCRITFAAKINVGRDWACYVCCSAEQETRGALEPTSFHMTNEAAVQNCLERGNKVTEEVARALFCINDESIPETYRK